MLTCGFGYLLSRSQPGSLCTQVWEAWINEELANVFNENPDSEYLVFVSHTVSVIATQPCCCSIVAKAAIDKT